MDPWRGILSRPETRHKYAYGEADPAGIFDPTGYFGLSVAELSAVNAIRATGITIQSDVGNKLLVGISQGPSAVWRDFLNSAVFLLDIAAVLAIARVGGALLRSPKPWRLSFDKGAKAWKTPAGLIYRQGSSHGNRVKHVLAHAVPDPSKKTHSVFSVPRREILPLVDEAWRARKSPMPDDPEAFIIPMRRAIGTRGEDAIKIIVRPPGSSKIVTAFPVFQ